MKKISATRHVHRGVPVRKITVRGILTMVKLYEARLWLDHQPFVVHEPTLRRMAERIDIHLSIGYHPHPAVNFNDDSALAPPVAARKGVKVQITGSGIIADETKFP